MAFMIVIRAALIWLLSRARLQLRVVRLRLPVDRDIRVGVNREGILWEISFGPNYYFPKSRITTASPLPNRRTRAKRCPSGDQANDWNVTWLTPEGRKSVSFDGAPPDTG